MDRQAVLSWLREHPAAVHEDPEALLERFEQEIRRHATADAWKAARAHVEERQHEWEQRWGFHASQAYAAKEICPELARELKGMEPHFEKGDEPHLVGEALLQRLEPEGRREAEEWIRDVANEVEHKIWQEIVAYTKRRGADLVREGRVSSDLTWEHTDGFGQQAARVAKILLEEFDARTPAED
jgi:hypothetical protein